MTAFVLDDDRLTFSYHPTGFDQKIRQNSVIRSICRSKFAHGTLSGRSAGINATERRIELEWSQVLAGTADIWNSPARRGRTRGRPPGQSGPIGATLGVACAGRSRTRLCEYGLRFAGNYRYPGI